MDPKLFEELTRSIRQAGAIARGERKPARRHELTPSRILAVRERSGLSQAQFARLLNVSVKTLQNWEQGANAARAGTSSRGPWRKGVTHPSRTSGAKRMRESASRGGASPSSR